MAISDVQDIVNKIGEGVYVFPGVLHRANAGFDASTGYAARQFGNMTGLTPRSERTLKDLYVENLDNERGRSREFEENNPVLANVAYYGSLAIPSFGAKHVIQSTRLLGNGATRLSRLANNIIKPATIPVEIGVGSVGGALIGHLQPDSWIQKLATKYSAEAPTRMLINKILKK